MPKLTLLLAFHSHQPDGNFEHVFQRAYDECYRPLLDLLGEFPAVRCALHHTGSLLEWMDAQRPGYLDDLAALVARKQVEILGGGFYEPMLAVLPEPDAQGQLTMMSQFAEQRLGMRPRGMWLAERVWEPSLAETISRAGLEYTLVDDTHFRYAGQLGPLSGYYVTDKAGAPLSIFPIEKELRYAIPFRTVESTMELLGELARQGADTIVTYGDDGEKFGLWPGTKDWVWGKGWLRSFFQALTQRKDLVSCATFSDILDSRASSGRVYLPTASYEEMGEWTLPADAQVRYQAARARFQEDKTWDELRPFFRGGLWQNFLAKYPEANFMHKKMVYVSRKLQRVPEALPEATRELYRAQCNCAYWHGLFGGLYLNYLRHAVYAHLIRADEAADAALGEADLHAAVEVLDFDADRRPEVILRSPALWVGVKPDLGGGIFELDLRPARFHLTNVLGRHPEAYHRKLLGAAPPHAGGDGPRSIHESAQVKEAGLEALIHYDRHPRLSFVDHFLAPGTTLDEFARSTYDERGDFAAAPYDLVGTHAWQDESGGEAQCELLRTAQVRTEEGTGERVTVEKTLSVRASRLLCRWRISLDPDGKKSPRELRALFAPELSVTLLAGDDEARRYELPTGDLTGPSARMNSTGELEHLSLFWLKDDWSGFAIRVETTGAPKLWRFPLETVSQSEAGLERTYQGSVLCPVWKVHLKAGDVFETWLSLSYQDTKGGPPARRTDEGYA
jgi:alpha-amylase